MDAEMVAAALNEAHTGVIKNLPSYASEMSVGSRFMDKFVQLPFVIPPPTEYALKNYTESLLLVDEEMKNTVGRVLEGRDLPARYEDIDFMIQESIEKGEINPEQGTYVKSQLTRDLDNIESRRVLEHQVKSYSDYNSEIKEQMLKASSEFSNNPRELKRFVNAYRYNYFIRSAINSQRRPKVNPNDYEPSLDQLTRWIILSMRWPELTRWLQHNYIRRASSQEESKGITEKRLKLIMELCEEKNSINMANYNEDDLKKDLD